MKEKNQLTVDKMPKFKKAYLKAVKEKKEVFIFEGNNILTKFAKHMIDYYNSHHGENALESKEITVSLENLATQLAKEATRDNLIKSHLINDEADMYIGNKLNPMVREIFDNWYDYFYNIIIKHKIES